MFRPIQHTRLWRVRSWAVSLAVVGAVALSLSGCGGDGGGQNEGSGLSTSESDAGGSGDTGGGDGSGDVGFPGRDVDFPTRDSGAGVGAACGSSSDCLGGVCLSTGEFEGGYCTSLNCQASGCPGSGAVCVTFQSGASGCLAACQSHDDCRDGYSCQKTSGSGDLACLPGEPSPPINYARTKQLLGMTCNPTEGEEVKEGTEYTFQFTLGNNADGFLMVPLVVKGSLHPDTLVTPNATVDLLQKYRHHNARLTDFYSTKDLTGFGTFGKVAMDWPILVPYAPRFSDMVVPGGTYELTVVATDDKPCLYVLDNRRGKVLDLNLYLVGAKGLDPQSAARDKDLGEALATMERIYSKAGVQIGDVRFFEPAEKIVKRFRIVRSREDAHRLMAYGMPPAATLEGHLSVDVFLVEDLQIQRGGRGGVLGMSAGVPGAGGLHGNARNGLVFETVDLGAENSHIGHIMAHEIGHYLGLRHTTELVRNENQRKQVEQYLGASDPINDTAVCDDIIDKIRRNRRSCKDFDNLMFPVAPPPSWDVNPRITKGQGEAMRANPLVH